MTDAYLNLEGNRLAKILPTYLVVQGVTLVMTFLDYPVYLEAYQVNHNLSVSLWLGGWFVLEIFGLSIGLILWISKTWKMVFTERVRDKLVAGYFLGVIVGLLALGLRFLPVISKSYFTSVGVLALLLAVVYFIRNRQPAHTEEMFP
jgi:peptidoglycan/LPS O-acetylase OafA/YrhL